MKAQNVQELMVTLMEMDGLCSIDAGDTFSQMDNEMSNYMIKNSRVLYLDFLVFSQLYDKVVDSAINNLDANAVIKAALTLREDEDAENFVRSIRRMMVAESIDWDPKLPFEQTFLFLGNKYDLLHDLYRNKEIPKFSVPSGFLISKTHVFMYFLNVWHDYPGGQGEMGMNSTLIPLLRESVPVIDANNHTMLFLMTLTIILKHIAEKGTKSSGLGYSQRIKKLKSVYRMPPTIRIVEMSPNDCEKGFAEYETRQAAYSYEVPEHDATWILRGSLPMEKKTAAYLKRDERRIILTDAQQITPEISRIFARRNIVMKSGEWISVLTVRRKQHVRGQGPLVDSVHVADKLFPHQQMTTPTIINMEIPVGLGKGLS